MITKSEQRIFRIYRQYLIEPGEMLCFSGLNLQQNEATLDLMCDKDLLEKQKFNGGYSLTDDGFSAMKESE